MNENAGDSFRLRNEDSEMYFFTPRHPSSGCPQRASRVAGNGYWKGYGKDRLIKIGSEVIGHSTALSYKSFNGKKEEKTGWIMHEYRLESPSKGVKVFILSLTELYLIRINSDSIYMYFVCRVLMTWCFVESMKRNAAKRMAMVVL